ncbi:response regulator [Halorussus gelatinilyticus]|uniref:Response regulator n=1 Tax=Halorussus gelatinilyticus TaxID=2937524 RepID=A0A8U0IFG7_9EURY|nr:response regulator [Halorussus gelatinilyticus]UPV99494.1 response regulator [Halorussus gelatinilyticus]
MSGPTIVCVDPDESAREETLDRLRVTGDDPTLVAAESLASAEESLRARSVDCVVTEHDLPDGTGLELASRVRDLRPSVGCVLYTAADREALATDEHDDAVAEYVAKGTVRTPPSDCGASWSSPRRFAPRPPTRSRRTRPTDSRRSTLTTSTRRRYATTWSESPTSRPATSTFPRPR